MVTVLHTYNTSNISLEYTLIKIYFIIRERVIDCKLTLLTNAYDMNYLQTDCPRELSEPYPFYYQGQN